MYPFKYQWFACEPLHYDMKITRLKRSVRIRFSFLFESVITLD